ncbi:MAG TPA: ankyrin repeat domain-containing protein [Terriglobales bacterium]|nr:ankyrin repeat domain-containing protein [Terriglobales bacterium]
MVAKDLGFVHLAVLRHDLKELKDVLSRGEKADQVDREGRTPLFYPARDGEVAIALELLAHGANPNAQDKNLETPLHFAARNYRTQIAEVLLQHGASVDVQDVHGNTALWRAVFESRGRGEMIKILRAHGADKNVQNKSGISPEKLARTIANYDLMQFFD